MAARDEICKDSEHIARLAAENDYFDWKTLWDANGGLSSKRADPNVLYKARIGGDIVKIPAKKTKNVAKAADNADDKPHVFKVPTYKVWLRLRILKDDYTPVKDAKYDLLLDRLIAPFRGKTNADGIIEHEIPVGSESAILTLRVKADDTDPPPPDEEEGEGDGGDDAAEGPAPVRGEVPIQWTFAIGKLNPISEKAPTSDCISGIQGRLNNLDMNTGPVDGILGPNTRSALKAFQQLYQIKVPKGSEGQPDGVTQKKLADVHDGPGPAPTPP